MTRDEAKEIVLHSEPDFLEPAKQKVKGKPTYVCPNPKCDNGTKKKGDGIVRDPHRDGNHYKCFSCGLHEDVIGLWKLHTGITDNKKAFDTLYQHYGLIVDNIPASQRSQQQPVTAEEPLQEPEADYTETFLKASEELNRLASKWPEERKKKTLRGISLDTYNRFGVGYAVCWKSPTAAQSVMETSRLIIPTGKGSYLARDTRRPDEVLEEYRDAYDRYKIMKVGPARLFNLQALEQQEKPVFIVEGEIDAMSIEDVGGAAVGLGSTAHVSRLLEELKARTLTQPLILALDNDQAGQEATERLTKGLEDLNVFFYVVNPKDFYGPYKDANEALQAHRDGLEGRVRMAMKSASEAFYEAQDGPRRKYRATSAANCLQAFVDAISDVNTEFIPTGFPRLDEVLEGGLYEGLYFIGAISSLGKTTFALQMMDQVAQSGRDVLIFSLEMARNELIAKSVSRLTFIKSLELYGHGRNAKTTRGITTFSRWANYSQAEKDLITGCISAYGEYAQNIFIREGVGDVGTGQIREAVKRHIELTGKKPVVLIDYVQILAPQDVRASDKQNMDKAVLELKRISRDFKIPVIGISSLNRGGYQSAVSMEAFKESGALEYGSDVLIGLQLKGAGEKGFDVNAAKSKMPREVELVILKNRNGATGGKVDFEYSPLFNHFEEKEIGESK